MKTSHGMMTKKALIFTLALTVTSTTVWADNTTSGTTVAAAAGFATPPAVVNFILSSIKNLGGNRVDNGHLGGNLIQIETQKLANVATESHANIQVVSEGGQSKFIFQYDDLAIANPQLMLADLFLLQQISGQPLLELLGIGTDSKKSMITYGRSYQVPGYYWAELYQLVQLGNPSAIARLARIKKDFLATAKISPAFATTWPGIEQVLLDQAAQKEIQRADAQKKALAFEREASRRLQQWKDAHHDQDNFEAQALKLNDLILNNDRKGVADMLRVYLPWTELTAVETQAWKTWLEAIEHPNLDDAVLAFRGVSYDTDKIQRKDTPQGEAFGFMSTVLTKNQGNYTRRLRSLETSHDKNADMYNADVARYAKYGATYGFDPATDIGETSATLSDQWRAHANDPKASMFLSFTYTLDVAGNFAGQNLVKDENGRKVEVPKGGLLAVRMDKRRLIPNLQSQFKNEVELLAPLIIFPDEVVLYREGYNRMNPQSKIDFINEMKQKAGVDYVAPDANRMAEFGQSGSQFMADLNSIARSGGGRLCRQVMRN